MINRNEAGQVCDRICEGIKSRKMSYAAFERALSLPPKTLSNWRRGISHGYLTMLPQIAKLLDTTPDILLGEADNENREWQKEADQLRALYVKARNLPHHRRHALFQTLRQVMELYIEQ